MTKKRKAVLLYEAAAAMAWGDTVEQTASRLGVSPEEIRGWMREDRFRSVWSQRFAEYVRYLQGPSVALLASQLEGTDEKARSAAAASLIKLGDQMDTEAQSSLKVHFAMPAPGEPETGEA